MKSCIEKIRPGDVVVCKLLRGSKRRVRYLIVSEVRFMDDCFSASVRRWMRESEAYGRAIPINFSFDLIHAVERQMVRDK